MLVKNFRGEHFSLSLEVEVENTHILKVFHPSRDIVMVFRNVGLTQLLFTFYQLYVC